MNLSISHGQKEQTVIKLQQGIYFEGGACSRYSLVEQGYFVRLSSE